jgi:hypothetical protein
MQNLSKEQIINNVEGHKDIIRDATDRLSEILYKYRKKCTTDLNLSHEESLEIRKILHEITSEVSMIGGFCDSWTRNYITKTVNIVSKISSRSKISYFDCYALELWAMRVNAIIIDYNKTPFRLSDLKPLASILERALKTLPK